MPIYEYTCNQCCCEFEKLALSADEPMPNCPHCGSDKVCKLMSAGCVRPHGIATGSGGFKAPACGPSAGG